MKKLMVSTIIVLPLLLLAIMLVSGAIMSLITHIYVEKVEFVKNDTLVLVLSDESNPPEEQLEVNILPLKAENRSLIYSVDDESVATIDENGKITAKYFGETYITVTSAENKAANARRKVLVTDNKVHAIKINQNYKNDMYKGDESQRFLAQVLPNEANNKDITWSTSDESILSISPSGEAVCKSAGTATITVTSVDNPSVSQSVEIRCHEPLTGISADTTAVLTAAKTAKFPEIIPTPSNATYTVAYASSNENVAKVDGEGNITFLQAGAVTVTATATDGRGNSFSVKVNYDSALGYYFGSILKTTQVTLDYDLSVNKIIGDIVIQNDLDGAYKEITNVEINRSELISYNPATKQFTLTEVGDDVALGEVVIKIHAKKYDLSKHEVVQVIEDICTVNITRATKSLSFMKGDNPISSSINIFWAEPGGGQVTIVTANSNAGYHIVASPANHTDKVILSASGDATIDGNGLVKFTDVGSATITAQAGGVTKEIAITCTKLQSTQGEITLDENTPQSGVRFTLFSEQSGATRTGVLNFDVPENSEVVIEYRDGNSSQATKKSQMVTVEKDENGVYTVTPKADGAGGFVTVTISFKEKEIVRARATSVAGDLMDAVYTLKLYIDKLIMADNIQFEKVGDVDYDSQSGFLTSKDSFNYKLAVNTVIGAMEGKLLKVGDQTIDLEWKNENDRYESDELTYNFSTSKTDELKLIAAVSYDLTKTLGFTSVLGDEIDEQHTHIGQAQTAVETTRGKLKTPPQITYNGKSLESGATIEFANLGDTATITINTASSKPTDYSFNTNYESDQNNVMFGALTCVTKQITASGDEATIILTAENTVDGEQEKTTLYVGGMQYALTIKVKSLADTVTLSFGGKNLTEKGSYKTYLTTLSLVVEISRRDNKTITDKTVTYDFAGKGGTGTADNNRYTIEIPFEDTKSGTLTVKCGTKEFKVDLAQISLANLSYHIEYTNNGKQNQITGVPTDGSTFNLTFPQGFQGAFDICLDGVEEGEFVLGNTDDNTMNVFSVEGSGINNGWDITKSGSDTALNSLKITCAAPQNKYFTGDQIILKLSNEIVVTFLVYNTTLQSISMTGYDPTNSTDVYKGYQQVTVYAKHSYYDGKTVDYFSVPVVAKADVVEDTKVDISTIVWDLTQYVGNEALTLKTHQVGALVEYTNANGVKTTYTIEPQRDETGALTGGNSTLKFIGADRQQTTICENGKFAANQPKVTWVDVYAEENKAHIYFGDCYGLAESDVQNDYFGNFDDKPEYSAKATVANDGSGRTFTPSDNTANKIKAYSFLKVEAGDGVPESKANTHFNFNVLADDTLCNVFNATGYYANSKIVLHNDLYGSDELVADQPLYTKMKETDQIMDMKPEQKNGSSPKEFAKDTVYGNGYQVNLNSLNTMIVGTGSTDTGGMMNHGGQENTGYATHFTSLYNVTMRGRNDAAQVNSAQFAILFNIKNVYYTDLQNYSKMNPKGGSMSIKNSVLRNVAVQALQLWNEATNPAATRGYWSAYLENVTFVNVSKCISIEGAADAATSKYHTIYIKGFFDVLNYYSFSTLKNMASAVADDGTVVSMLSASLMNNQTPISNYVEWFGEKQEADADLTGYDTVDRGGDGIPFNGPDKVFVNPVIVDTAIDGQTKLAPAYWVNDPVGGLGGKIMSWNGTAYIDALNNTNGVKVAHPLSGMDHDEGGKGNGMITAYTYASTNESDGGHVDEASTVSNYYPYKPVPQSLKVFRVSLSRNLGKLFSEERDIRLLCQYLDVDGDGNPIRNDAHILWHTQKVYRDMTLVNKGYDPEHPDSGREENHIEALKQSLIDAKAKNLWDGEWPDGTTLDNALAAAQAAAQAAAYTHDAILPDNKQYA